MPLSPLRIATLHSLSNEGRGFERTVRPGVESNSQEGKVRIHILPLMVTVEFPNQ